MEIQLTRTFYPDGTNGVIKYEGKIICYTLELPWRKNLPMMSCIPEGRYLLEKRCSDRYGDHLLLRGVPDRSRILIHPANHVHKQFHGCIAPVTKLIAADRGTASKAAFTKLVNLVYANMEKGDVSLAIHSEAAVVSIDIPLLGVKAA